MKVAILNDTHCGVRNSSDIFLKYHERFYNEIFFPYLKEHNIKNILHLGDYYEHRKFVNFKALNANRKHFLEPMRDMGITMDIIPGNHDVYFKNTNELCSLKELLGYFTTNVNIIMKSYLIKCKCGASFEGQFPSSKSFREQKKRNMIICPMCDGINLKFSKINSKVKPKNSKTVSPRLT